MNFKVVRFISRKEEEADFPEDDPDRMNLERFHKVVRTNNDLLQMSAGIPYDEDPPYHDDDVTYHAADLRKAALERTAIVDPPGK